MKKGKNILLRGMVFPICTVLAGLLLLTNPDLGSAAVAAIIGWGLIIVGAVGCGICLLSWPILGIGEILLGLIAIATGIYLLINPLMLAKMVGLLLGIVLAYQGITALLDARKLRRKGLGFKFNLILSVLMLVLGVVLIFSPLTASQLVMTLCGIALIIFGGVSLVNKIRIIKALQAPAKPKVIDADK